MNTASIFHKITKIKHRPEESKKEEQGKIYFSEYPRMRKILLPKPRKLNFSIDRAIIERCSVRKFRNTAIPLEDLSQLIFYSAGIIRKEDNDFNKSHRAYPSAGMRFPLEIYLFNFRENPNLGQGVYHYNVKGHFLEKIFADDNLRNNIYPEIIWQNMILDAPIIIVISAVFERTMTKYQDRGYRHILIEAGHLGQNIYLTSTALGLNCCAIGGFAEDGFSDILDFDESEDVIYVFAIGKQ